jgi:hypothetical protein
LSAWTADTTLRQAALAQIRVKVSAVGRVGGTKLKPESAVQVCTFVLVKSGVIFVMSQAVCALATARVAAMATMENCMIEVNG